jgi:glycosyltransferase involved in cell wall biosynthesis
VPALERRFGVRPEQCHFAPFPINERAAALPTTDGNYVYAAGWAHRDWPTLVRALSSLPYRGILCSGFPIEVPAGCTHIETPPMPGPDEGRQLMANARVVVLPLEDTDLPAGPLVLLDAMAAGKAVVATRVNGTRDYVEDGRTALVVPPADPDAMAAAIRRLMEEDTLRREIGRRAREDVRSRCTMDNLLSRVVEVCAGDAAPIPVPVARVEAASGARR